MKWSFDALLEGRYPARDPDGREFAPGSRWDRRKGTPILRDGLRAVIWTVSGDLDFYANTLELPHYSRDAFCWLCRADRQDRPWSDMRAQATWRRSQLTPREMQREPASTHPLFAIDGVTTRSLCIDFMHTFDLGVSGHCVANCLHTMVYFPGSRPLEAFAALWGRMQALFGEMGLEHRPTAMALKNIANTRAPFAEYPALTGISAAETRHLVRVVHRLAEDRVAPGSEPDALRARLMRHLVDIYNHIERDEYYVRDPAALMASTDQFLQCYATLARLAMDAGKHLWSLVPKHHFAWHVAQQAAFENPRMAWCYSGEDFCGRTAKLGHMGLTGKPMHDITAAVVPKWRLGFHLRCTRV
jgi:hypothetical protein